MSKIKKIIEVFYGLTKEPFDYIANLFAVGVIFSWIIEKFDSLGFQLKVATGFGLVFLVVLFFRNIRNLYNYVMYRYEIKQLDISLQKKALPVTSSDYPVDYEKIIPKTNTLKFLLKKAEKIVKERWAKDAILNECGILITNRFSKSIEIDMDLSFWSQLKKMEVSFGFSKLKLPRKKPPDGWELAYRKKCTQVQPFFLDPLWRGAVIVAFQSTESALVNKKFFCIINGNYPYGMRVSICPEEAVSRWYVYRYDNKEKKLYTDEYPIEKASIVADFN